MIIQKGDMDNLEKLLDVYSLINDEKSKFFFHLDIMKISAKIIQKSKLLVREKLIDLFDKIYSIISKYRNSFKSLEDLELIEKEKSMHYKIN